MDNNKMIKDIHLKTTKFENPGDEENYNLRNKGYQLLCDLENESKN